MGSQAGWQQAPATRPHHTLFMLGIGLTIGSVSIRMGQANMIGMGKIIHDSCCLTRAGDRLILICIHNDIRFFL